MCKLSSSGRCGVDRVSLSYMQLGVFSSQHSDTICPAASLEVSFRFSLLDLPQLGEKPSLMALTLEQIPQLSGCTNPCTLFNHVFIANPISKGRLRYRRSRQKVVASQEVDSILEQAVETAKTDIELAKKQAAIARRICLKFNIRLPYVKRQLFCRGCKQFIAPGINARARISSKPRTLILTCLDCEHTYRRPLKTRKPK